MHKFDWKNCLKIGIGVFILFLLIHYWDSISGVIGTVISSASPIFTGLIAAYIVNILMSFYERHYFPKSQKKAVIITRRPVCLAGAVITVLGIVILIVVLVAPQVVNCIKMLTSELPGAIEMIINKLKKFDLLSDSIINTLSSIDWKSKIGDIAETLTTGLGNVMDVALSALTSLFSVVSSAIIGCIFALYLLIDKDRLIRQIKKLAKHIIPEKFAKKAAHVATVTNGCFRRFIVGQCTEAVILGTLCTLGMLVLRLPYAPMIGALVAFTALIPIVGAFIGAGVGAFLIFVESPVQALVFLIFIIVLQQIEGNLIYPKVVGSSIGLPGIWVLAAVTIGGGVLGIGGMLIGVPTVATIYKLTKERINTAEKAAESQKAEETAADEFPE